MGEFSYIPDQTEDYITHKFLNKEYIIPSDYVCHLCGDDVEARFFECIDDYEELLETGYCKECLSHIERGKS